MMFKKNSKLNLLGFALLIVLLFLVLMVPLVSVIANKKEIRFGEKRCNGLPLLENSVSSVFYDNSTLKKAIGINDYVFVAKINRY